MLSFLFDNYGYYPNDLADNTFDYKNWIFKLTRVDEDEKNISSIEQFDERIRNCFNGFAGHVIKNRNNQYITYSNGVSYSLITVPKVNINIYDYFKLHTYFKNIESNKNYSLSKIEKVLEEKYEFIETVVLPSIRRDVDSYSSYLFLVFYNFGLAENALQYLSDAINDFGDKLSYLTLTHKKEASFNSVSFYSPFNFIIDHPIRDIAQILKNENLGEKEIIEFLNLYNLNTQEASVLFALILYPQKIFDELIEFYDNKKDISFYLFEEQKKISFNKEKIKYIYYILQYKYNIRPIKWIENDKTY